MAENDDSVEEGAIRSRIVAELLESLAQSKRIMLDTTKDLKTRERWTQLHMSTSQTLNTVHRDKQLAEFERKLRFIEESRQLRAKNLRLGESSLKTRTP